MPLHENLPDYAYAWSGMPCIGCALRIAEVDKDVVDVTNPLGRDWLAGV